MRFDLTINGLLKKFILMKNLSYHADTWKPYLNLIDLSLIVGKIIKNTQFNKKQIYF